ncbi:MAG TPA: serine hydrolase [Candidatus Saccharimonadia bacterium]|nr:serine hydrolase [Candidatus Saccharimonadia bacterium]
MLKELFVYRAKLGLTSLVMGMAVLMPGGAVLAETTPSPTPGAAQFAAPDIPWLIASQQVAAIYHADTAGVPGNWHSYVTVADSTGALKPAVDDQADTPMWAYSVNKLAVAMTVMDKVDKGEVKLDQKLTLTPDIIASGSGIYFLQTVYGDNLTVANLMTAMLLVSDNTAVRMLSQVASGTEINQTLAAKGFTATHVDPVAGSSRFFLGQTTPREMNTLLAGLANHSLVSEKSSTFVLNIMRWVNGYNDGVRRNMSSTERAQVATKYGAFEDSRHEVGIMFDAAGKPALIYAFMNDGVGDIDNYGSTNPAVEAEDVMGRQMFDIMDGKWGGRPLGSLVPRS